MIIASMAPLTGEFLVINVIEKETPAWLSSGTATQSKTPRAPSASASSTSASTGQKTTTGRLFTAAYRALWPEPPTSNLSDGAIDVASREAALPGHREDQGRRRGHIIAT
jgi:hypothetical protein